jgi:hypothetical protein
MKVKDTIKSTILKNNYIAIDHFMSISLSQCSDSYYIDKNPIGDLQDFITAPEISQMFGEIIGIWVLEKWIEMGSPSKFNLIELGPGRGSLMKDLLNITKHNKDFYIGMNIHLVEINETLIKIQKERLQEHINKIDWHNNIINIERYPTIIIGNEFLDSLPIKQYIKIDNDWKERVIIINKNSQDFEFESINIHDIDIENYLNQYESAQDGSIIEFSYESKNYINLINNIFGNNKLSCLLIDYGYYIEPQNRRFNQYNSTLQVIQNHKFCDIFFDIGKIDLTSHIDFYMISNLAKKLGLKVKKVLSQKEFLKNHGIDQRLKFLLKGKDLNLQNILLKQYKRLVDEKEMGDLFKVLEINSIY